MPKDVINRLADTVADQTSRRRFFGWLVKGALGVAGLAIGERLTTQPASARALNVPLLCCGGSGCATYSCPGSEKVYYTWVCCMNPPVERQYYCKDCGTFRGGQWWYDCTYTVDPGQFC